MTSPVFEPKAPRRKRRSALKRQRMLILVLLILVGMLGGTFGVVYYYTSRNLVTLNGEALTDADGTRYYSKMVDGVWVIVNEHGDVCQTTEDSNSYGTVARTADGALIEVEHSTGAVTVVAIVDKIGDEETEYNSSTNAFDILMYPLLERAQIKSIRVVNEQGEFTFMQLQECTNSKCQKNGDSYEKYVGYYDDFPKNEQGKLICPKCGALAQRSDFCIKGFPLHAFDDTMFSTLVICTGYTSTYMRLDREKVQYYGYGEYGLPEDPADAKNYFEITDLSGKTRKVIIGDMVVAGTGYYVMLEGNPDVYILKDMEETQYNYTFTKALLSSVEAYITPTVMDTMTSTDYMDVTDFKLNTVAAITEELLDDPNFTLESLLTNVVRFSYVPIELRNATFESTSPYSGGVKYEGFGVSDYMIDDCLQNLMDLTPLRTVKLFTLEENIDQKGLFYFIQEYGLGYCLEYTHHTKRKADYTPDEFIQQQIWISPLSEDGTYFLYNDVYQMIVEVDRSYLEFLGWDTFTWVEGDVFDGNIAYLREVEILIPGGLTSGPHKGVKKLSFKLDNTESLTGWDPETTPSMPSSKLKVWVKMDNGESIALTKEQLTQFRLFYQTLIYSSLSGSASCSEEQQQAFRDAALNVDGNYVTADGQNAQIVINMTYNTGEKGDGEDILRSYAFYKYGGGRQSFMAYNGNGGFYILQNRVDKIVSDAGKIFDPALTIDPQSKS